MSTRILNLWVVISVLLSQLGLPTRGAGDRYQQTVDGATTTYTLDLSGDLSQVLSNGQNTYIYLRHEVF